MNRVWSHCCMLLLTCTVSFFVGCNDDDSTSPSSAQIVMQLPMNTGPEGLCVYGDSLYVCETGLNFPDFGAGQIKIYNRITLELLDSLQVGVNPQYAAVDPFGRLHVACTGNYTDVAGEIYVIDPRTRSYIQVLAIGGTPNTVSFGGGLAYVAAGGFGTNGVVYRYRVADLTILNDASNPIETAVGATDVEAQEDGSFYVSCFEADAVQHYDSSGTLLESYAVSDGPSYMAVYGGTHLYVVQSNDESLAEINVNTGEVNPHVVGLGLYANDIVVHESRLYVTNSGDNTIQEIFASTHHTLRVNSVSPGVNPWTIAFLNEDSIAVSCLVSREVLIMRL